MLIVIIVVINVPVIRVLIHKKKIRFTFYILPFCLSLLKMRTFYLYFLIRVAAIEKKRMFMSSTFIHYINTKYLSHTYL